jgi:hypothetical protein
MLLKNLLIKPCELMVLVGSRITSTPDMDLGKQVKRMALILAQTQSSLIQQQGHSVLIMSFRA